MEFSVPNCEDFLSRSFQFKIEISMKIIRIGVKKITNHFTDQELRRLRWIETLY